MTADDLELVERWLLEPHVARWWLVDVSAAHELEQMRKSIVGEGDQQTRLLTVTERADERGVQVPIGWCQWYPYDAYPEEAAAVGARPGEVGVDYAIGDPAATGRGLGTELIAVLVAEVRRQQPGCGVIVDPDAQNEPSRRVLEKNGFDLVAVRPVATEPGDHPMAIYRLEQASEPGT